MTKAVQTQERKPDAGLLPLPYQPHIPPLTLFRPIAHPLEKPFNAVIKRTIDIILSFIVIVLVFPWLFPLIALTIRIDSTGPIFFIQQRIKKNGSVFQCIKFRTMVRNGFADLLPAVENDERITRVGKYLRIYHLDELPQLWNVLLGDMSIIGPRPYMISDYNKYSLLVKDFSLRHEVKPGLTGLAQVKGLVGPILSTEIMETRVAYDLHYIRHWSLANDVMILYQTLLHLPQKIKQRP